MACACGNKTSFTEIVRRDGSSLPSLKYWHCKYQQQFEALFLAATGLPIKENHLQDLARLSDTGGDRAGVLKDGRGNPIVFSVEDTLKRIDLSRVSNYTCSI